MSVDTTSEGIENTLTNRLIAWEDVAPVVRALGMQWKAEQEAEQPAPAPSLAIAAYVKSKLHAGEKFTSQELFAEAVYRVHERESVSTLFSSVPDRLRSDRLRTGRAAVPRCRSMV